MKLFPVVLFSWNEPAAYSYGRTFNAVWPKSWPISGYLVQFCDDCIWRRSGKSGLSIDLDNLAACAVSTRVDSSRKPYYVFSFTLKKATILRAFLGCLQETACDSRETTDNIITQLRARGVQVQGE